MIWKHNFFVYFLAFAAIASCLPATAEIWPRQEECEELAQRKSWHTLTNDEKKSYLDAELCLMNTSYTNSQLPGTKTYFQAFQEQHQIQADWIHGVGGFLPFHRYMTWAHEYLLQTECGYTGVQPYWDEPLDAGAFTSSILLDTEYGFGGNGRSSDRCVVDGPFANYTLIIGPGSDNTEHCLSRNIDDQASRTSNSTYVESCLNLDTYVEAWNCIEGVPHPGGHGGIGGEMVNVRSSPGDPLFYMHHAFIDKVWWDWQAANLTSRLYAINGTNIASESGPGGGGPGGSFPSMRKRGGSFPTLHKRVEGQDGDPGNTTTLGHVLSLLEILPNKTVNDVMDIRAGFLCYEYV